MSCTEGFGILQGMYATILLVLTLLSYSVASLLYMLQWRSVPSQPGLKEVGVSWYWCTPPAMVSLAALVAHSLLLHRWIDSPVGLGQNLSLFNMLSLVAWLVALFAFLTQRRTGTLLGLAPFAFVLAMGSILLAFFSPSTHFVQTAAMPPMLIHILLAAVTLSVLCLSGLFGLLIIVQEKQLRFKSLHLVLWPYLPPLQTMDILLFRTLRFGFILLSAVLLTSLYSFSDKLTISWVLDKSIVALLAWLVFAVLLIGRRWFGWRGCKAGYGALAGVALIVLASLGCQLVMESFY